MHGELSFPCGAAHAHVLQGPAESGQLVALEVGHHDHGIRVDYLFRDIHFGEYLPGYGHPDPISSSDAVRDDDRTARPPHNRIRS